MNLLEWAIAWNVPMIAVEDLRRRMGMEGNAATVPAELRADPRMNRSSRASEEYVQSVVRLEAPRKGVHLWRNNVGALTDERGVPVRYGLANDSAKMNKVLKSADLIGCRPVEVYDAHGRPYTIGQFVSRECKRVGWNYAGDSHEVAQLNWANLILSLGGDAGFVTGEGSL